MALRFAAVFVAWLSSPVVGLAQQQAVPAPLYPGPFPRSIELEPLPPAPTRKDAMPPAVSSEPSATPPSSGEPAAAAAMSGATERVFCGQPITVQLADSNGVAARYRPFVGIWSDASWTPQLCAALIVENVAPDGIATIVYVFGPMDSSVRRTGGILRGTGVIRDGELRFQNSDGSQFAFHPLYADFQGHLTTPHGQSYQAIFKKAP